VVTFEEARVDPAALAAARAARAEAANGGGNARPKWRGDPTIGLDERERVLWGTLREWRARKAHEEGVPRYVVLTNRQLTEIVVKKPESLTALGHISGVGQGKVERYGRAILEVLHGRAESPSGRGEAPHGGPQVEAHAEDGRRRTP
jgi:ATP-dependent DNA helicase RecQ